MFQQHSTLGNSGGFLNPMIGGFTWVYSTAEPWVSATMCWCPQCATLWPDIEQHPAARRAPEEYLRFWVASVDQKRSRDGPSELKGPLGWWFNSGLKMDRSQRSRVISSLDGEILAQIRRSKMNWQAVWMKHLCPKCLKKWKQWSASSRADRSFQGFLVDKELLNDSPYTCLQPSVSTSRSQCANTSAWSERQSHNWTFFLDTFLESHFELPAGWASDINPLG